MGDFIDKLNIMIENLRKEMYAKFTEKDRYNELKQRVDELEKLSK